MPYATPEDVAPFLDQLDMSEPSGQHYDTFVELLARAQSIVDEVIHPISFGDYTSAETRTVFGSGSAYLELPPHRPGSITLVADAEDNDLDGFWRETESTGSLIAFSVATGNRGNWGYGPFEVTAEWGYGPPPRAIVQVVVELTVNMWQARDAGQFSDVVGVEGGGAVGYKAAMTKQQAMILQQVRSNRLRGLAV